MQGPRAQQPRGRSAQGRKPAAPEEFPPLSDDAQSAPPPYAPQAGPSRPPHGQFLVSIAPSEYYLPSSFPGYTAVQLANGGEEQALLPRSAASIRRSAQNEQRPSRRPQVRRRRRRGCLRRCCGRLCSCLCFAVGLLILGVLASSVLYVARHVLPPSWDWQCSHLEPHADQSFAFPLAAPLRIESIDGVSISNVFLAAGNRTDAVHVRAVVEANQGNWRDRIHIDRQQDALRVRVVRPQWEWPRDCVRASLYISVPAAAASDSDLSALPSLHVATGAGMLRALDAGSLALGDLTVDMRNGLVQLRGLAVRGALLVSTSNGRINATDVRAQSRVVLSSNNGAVSLSRLAAERVTATTSNASIRISDVAARTVALHTANAPVSLRALAADQLSVLTTNAAVRGDVRIGSSAVVQTSNGAVSLELGARDDGGAVEDERQITVRSTNNAVELDLDRIEGSFDVATTNSRADVSGRGDLIELRRSSETLKSGRYGDAGAARISLTTSNARASLRFAS
ncbi:hypothetical protein IWW55_002036 [Coemansia sp. RSA 2706]|nr:hypothetical protein IWW55_002036 [Coemansia sp. RSA 2706]